MPHTTVLSVKEFRSLRGKRRQSVAVKLTARQWEQALVGLTFAAGVPPEDFRGVRLVETPGLGGGIVLPECPSPCQFRFQDGKFQCACTATDDDPGGQGLGPLEFCALLIGPRGTIRCAGRCVQSGHACQIRAWQIPRARVMLLSCGCSRV